MPLRAGLALILALVAGLPLRGVDARTWSTVKKLLPRHLWLEDPAARRKARVDEIWSVRELDRARLTKRQMAELGRILRAGSPFTTEKRRSRTLCVATGKALGGEEKERLPVRVEVTTKYEPGCGRSFPLVITLHGGPLGDRLAAERAAGDQLRLWRGYTSTAECIVAAPALTGQSYGAREWIYLENVIDEIDRIYNVDRDRVLLTGHSWGGILTWHLGPPHADMFCLLAPFVCAVNPGKRHLENLRALPVYHVQGRKDIPWIVHTGRERSKVLDDLGYEHTYREMPGRHIAFTGEIAKIAKRFGNTPRRLYAPHLVRRETVAGRNTSDLWYWIRSDDRSFTAALDPRTRTIDVDLHGDFEVFLADEMLDLDGPITIRRRGEVVWRGEVERSLAFALAHVKETGDRGRVFAASVRIE